MIDPLIALSDSLDGIDTNLTTSTATSRIQYPFMYIDSVSEVELRYLKKQLPQGDISLFVKTDEGYAFVQNTTISLETIKHLSRFKERDIWVKEDKETKHPIDSFINMLLLEEVD